MMPCIGVRDKRTSVGIDIVVQELAEVPVQESSNPQSQQSDVEEQAQAQVHASPLNPYPPSNGCSHSERQWLKSGFADLRLTCLSCRAEFDQQNPFARKP
jgi:hypothetical protein